MSVTRPSRPNVEAEANNLRNVKTTYLFDRRHVGVLGIREDAGCSAVDGADFDQISIR